MTTKKTTSTDDGNSLLKILSLSKKLRSLPSKLLTQWLCDVVQNDALDGKTLIVDAILGYMMKQEDIDESLNMLLNSLPCIDLSASVQSPVSSTTPKDDTGTPIRDNFPDDVLSHVASFLSTRDLFTRWNRVSHRFIQIGMRPSSITHLCHRSVLDHASSPKHKLDSILKKLDSIEMSQGFEFLFRRVGKIQVPPKVEFLSTHAVAKWIEVGLDLKSCRSIKISCDLDEPKIKVQDFLDKCLPASENDLEELLFGAGYRIVQQSDSQLSMKRFSKLESLAFTDSHWDSRLLCCSISQRILNEMGNQLTSLHLDNNFSYFPHDCHLLKFLLSSENHPFTAESVQGYKHEKWFPAKMTHLCLGSESDRSTRRKLVLSDCINKHTFPSLKHLLVHVDTVYKQDYSVEFESVDNMASLVENGLESLSIGFRYVHWSHLLHPRDGKSMGLFDFLRKIFIKNGTTPESALSKHFILRIWVNTIHNINPVWSPVVMELDCLYNSVASLFSNVMFVISMKMKGHDASITRSNIEADTLQFATFRSGKFKYARTDVETIDDKTTVFTGVIKSHNSANKHQSCQFSDVAPVHKFQCSRCCSTSPSQRYLR